MTEFNKYDSFLSELSSLETQAAILIEKLQESLKKNRELEDQLHAVKKDNEYLKLHVESLEKDLESVKGNFAEDPLFADLTSKEREKMKQKISDMISRINFHLSSS